MNTSTSWKLKLLDANDGSGDGIFELPDELLEILDCTEGDVLSMQLIKKDTINIKKLGMAVDNLTSKRLSYVDIDQMSSTDFFKHVIDGVSSKAIQDLAFDMEVSQSALCKMLGLSPSAISRKIKTGKHLSATEGELVLGLGKLIGQLKALYNDSGEIQDFKTTTWLASWFQEPVPAFSGVKPVKYLCSIAGQQYVGKLIRQAIHCSYA